MLTGLMPNRNGAMLNHQPPRDEVKKLPAWFHELGYEVVAFGKVSHYRQTSRYGFDHFAHDTFHDAKCISAALEYLQNRQSDKPLCLFVGTNWPHVPWPNDFEGYDPAALELPSNFVATPETRAWRARYYAAVTRFDQDLGKVYETAREKLGQNLLFMHFSDHGAQWPFGKWNLYDTGTRVPCFVVWPGVVAAGSKSDALVSLVDVLPTLVQAAGGEPPANLDGRSFLPVLRGASREHREEIFTTHSRDREMNVYPCRAVRTRRWKYIRNLDPDVEHTTHIDKAQPKDGSGYFATWVERSKTDPAAAAIVERYHHRPAEELYDLLADPREQKNVAGDSANTTVLADLRQSLADWMKSQGDEGLATERELAERQADSSRQRAN
jgi:uncharacterized sulfatase